MLSDKKKNEIKNLLFYLSLIVLPMIQFIIFYVVVNANSIALAFKSYEYKGGVLQEKFVWFDTIAKVAKDVVTQEKFKYCIINSIVLYFVTFLFGNILSMFFSYYIYKKRLLSGTFKTFLYMPSIVSAMVISVLYMYFFADCYPEMVKQITGKTVAGWSKNFQTQYALIFVFNGLMSLGGNMLVYTGTMAGISESVIEASEVDGVNSLQQLWYIVLPQIYSTFSLFAVTGLLVLFSGQANMFNFFGLKADAPFYTFGYYMYIELQANVNDLPTYSYLAALGFLLTVVAIPLIFTVRYLLNKFGPKEV